MGIGLTRSPSPVPVESLWSLLSPAGESIGILWGLDWDSTGTIGTPQGVPGSPQGHMGECKIQGAPNPSTIMRGYLDYFVKKPLPLYHSSISTVSNAKSLL